MIISKSAPKILLEQRTIRVVQENTGEGLFPSRQVSTVGSNDHGFDMADSLNKNTSAKSKTVWIDLDNSPHVPFFLPIIKRLQKSGYRVVLTARDSYQVCELLEFYKVDAQVVGKHYGKHKIFKVLGTILRALQLARRVRPQKPNLSLSHGSRGCVIASRLMGVQSIVLGDYEFTNKLKLFGPEWLIFPEMVPDETISGPGVKILKYPGIKEDVYVSNLHPDRELRTRLGIAKTDLLITVRPPATEAHYHNPESEGLLVEALRKFSGNPDVKILLLPRNKRQDAELRHTWSKELAANHILIPDHVEDGLNIIWNSDLVISGGGTMNREAAALGVPVYSIFRGKTGAVDRYLAETGRLVMLESVADVHSKLALKRRDANGDFHAENRPALQTIFGYIEAILESRNPVGTSRDDEARVAAHSH